jgi:stage V sporulation protein B
MDTIVINKRLIFSGFTSDMADKLYSAYTSLSLAISELLPSTFVYPIAISILPFVSGALAAKKTKEAERNMMNSIRLSGLIALPCAAVLCALARPCIGFIYGIEYKYSITMLDGTVKTPLDIAAPALSILGIGVFFISMVSTTNSLLQACGKPMLPVVSVLSGVVLLTVCEITLVGNKSVGIYGAPISSVVCYATAFTLNFVFLRKKQGLNLNVIKLFGKNIVSALCCGAGAFGVYKGIMFILGTETRLNCLICLVPAGITAIVIYVALTLLLKGATAEEIELLPKGRTLAAFLKRKNLI